MNMKVFKATYCMGDAYTSNYYKSIVTAPESWHVLQLLTIEHCTFIGNLTIVEITGEEASLYAHTQNKVHTTAPTNTGAKNEHV